MVQSLRFETESGGGELTKENWCRWSCQAERRRSSKHRNRGGGLRGVYRNFLFLCNQWQ